MKRMLATLAAAALLVAAAVAQGAEIKIGLLSDLTGPTADVGQPYAEGIKACADWLNRTDYIPGDTIKLIQVDYAYNAQKALTAYRRFTSQENIVALQGWGTQDTEALTRFVARDEIPTLSASYSAHLTDPRNAPYNFFVATDYSTQMRAALKFLKQNWKESRAPKLALVFPDHPYGLSPIPAGKAYAQELGFEIVGEENVELSAIDATTQLLALKQKKPDFTWIGGTTQSTAVIMKDAQKLDMETTFFANIWGVDESLMRLAGEAADGHYSLQTAVVYGADVPGMKIIEKLTGGEHAPTHYMRGFASMYVMAEGIKRARAKGEVTGPAIKDALETLRGFDPMGLTPPISYFPDDHRPNMAVFLYQVQDDKLIKAGEVNLERKKEWLGK